MTVSQRPSASTPLRIARKISPSDQCFNGPAGVRLEDMNDPTGIGKSSPMSRPPVSVPVFEWHAPQKPSTIPLPRAIRSGVASTLRIGIGAVRTCCLTIPTIMSAQTDDAATAGTTPPHFKNLFLIPEAQKPDQISDAAIAALAIKPKIFCMLLLNDLCAGKPA